MHCVKTARRSKCIEAVKRCDRDAIVLTAVARIFASENKFTKAQRWFERVSVGYGYCVCVCIMYYCSILASKCGLWLLCMCVYYVLLIVLY